MTNDTKIILAGLAVALGANMAWTHKKAKDVGDIAYRLEELGYQLDLLSVPIQVDNQEKRALLATTPGAARVIGSGPVTILSKEV